MNSLFIRRTCPSALFFILLCKYELFSSLDALLKKEKRNLFVKPLITLFETKVLFKSLIRSRVIISVNLFVIVLILPGKIVPERDEFMEPVDGGKYYFMGLN